MKTKIFTVDEANALLTVITPLIKEIQEEQAKASILEHEFQLSNIISNYHISMSPGNNTGEKQSIYNRHIHKINLLISRIHSFGCQVKDLEMGLVDFLSDLDSRPVFLCWKLGEKEIQYYHEINAGFNGRKSILFS